jgi:hypothetical protein
MILFLDFDGVLHPDPCEKNELFCNLVNFEALLRAYPDIEVVISSTWRLTFDITSLRSYFSEDLQHRIIDKTPRCSAVNYPRGRECEEWLQREQRQDEVWLAIDDWPYHFDDMIGRQLFLTDSDIGLDVEAIERLRIVIDALVKS